MRKIVVINQKGGTGKTTTSATIAAGLCRHNKKVLLIDMDPQGGLGIWHNLRFRHNLFHLLVENTDLDKCLYPVNDHLWLIPSNKTLAQAEIFMATRNDREKTLIRAMENLDGMDYVILDCAPSLNLLNLNAMLYADEAFVPVAMDYFSLIGAREVIDNLEWIQAKMGHKLKIGMIIPTFYDKRDRKSQEVLESLNNRFGQNVSNPVRKNVKLSEAVGVHQDIFTYAPKSYGAEDYDKIVRKVLNGE